MVGRIFCFKLKDKKGNKIRQFTGMTESMDIELLEGDSLDNRYNYGSYKYSVKVDSKGQEYRESKYDYSLKNELVKFTDTMGTVATDLEVNRAGVSLLDSTSIVEDTSGYILLLSF